MRKTQRASKSSAKKSATKKQGANKKAPARKAAGRIPVRGSRSTGGVSRRDSTGAAGSAGPARAPAPPRADLPEVRALAVSAMEAALDKKALAPVLIDVSAMASYTDFIGIVSGRSDRQVDAISDHICQQMKAEGRHLLGQEGTGSGRWTLLDFGSFVIHVFYHPVREFYDLESLWIDAPRVKLDVPPDATLSQSDAFYGAL